MTPELARERLAGRIKVTPSGCHEFTGTRNPNGYGQLTIQRTVVRAHRVSWIANFGPIPDGLSVLHRCDNPPCINPTHLFLGTQSDNIKDAYAKGRAGLGLRPDEGRLSAETVAEIRALEGKRLRRLIAQDFDVSESTVSRIWAGRMYGRWAEGRLGTARRGRTPGTPQPAGFGERRRQAQQARAEYMALTTPDPAA